ncbi:MAG: helix-turn-helix domain-containing protein [Candidatus Aminicenantales bacterium]
MGEKEIQLLKKFKQKTGWSYVRIAEEIGVHYQSVVAWFAGRKVPGNLGSKAIREFLEKQKGG